MVWAPRRLGAQQPLRVGCPRVCIELMYQSRARKARQVAKRMARRRTRAKEVQVGLALGGATASKKSAGRCRTAFKLVQSHPASIRISSASQSTCVGQRMAGNWARSMGSLPRTTLASLQSSPIASYGPMGRRGPPASKCRTTPSALMRGLTPGCCLSARECREMETHLIQGHLSLSV